MKNTDLKHSFYGLAYTPAGSQLPDCGNTIGEQPLFICETVQWVTNNVEAVIEDIQVSRLRKQTG